MKLSQAAAAVIAIALTAPMVRAQEFPKPGPEHEIIKLFVGNWDLTMKMQGAEIKGSSTYKMDLGGLWLSSTFEGDIFGTKFFGKGMDTYDPLKKKYVSVWFDSMSTYPMVMEGDYDKAKKKMTLIGEGRGMDGKMVKHRSVSEIKNADTVEFAMYVGDDKEPQFTITYKRKK